MGQKKRPQQTAPLPWFSEAVSAPLRASEKEGDRWARSCRAAHSPALHPGSESHRTALLARPRVRTLPRDFRSQCCRLRRQASSEQSVQDLRQPGVSWLGTDKAPIMSQPLLGRRTAPPSRGEAPPPHLGEQGHNLNSESALVEGTRMKAVPRQACRETGRIRLVRGRPRPQDTAQAARSARYQVFG